MGTRSCCMYCCYDTGCCLPPHFYPKYSTERTVMEPCTESSISLIFADDNLIVNAKVSTAIRGSRGHAGCLWACLLKQDIVKNGMILMLWH